MSSLTAVALSSSGVSATRWRRPVGIGTRSTPPLTPKPSRGPFGAATLSSSKGCSEGCTEGCTEGCSEGCSEGSSAECSEDCTEALDTSEGCLNGSAEGSVLSL